MTGKSFLCELLLFILLILYTCAIAYADNVRLETVVQTGHSSRILAFAISPDNRTLATGGQEGYVKLWDFETGKELKTFNTTQDGMITSMCFCPDGKRLALGFGSGGHGGYVILIDLQTGRESPAIAHDELVVSNIVFSREGRYLACDKKYEIIIYDLEAEKVLAKYLLDDPGLLMHTSFTNIVSAGNGSILASGTSYGPGTSTTLKVWDAVNSRPIASITLDPEWAGITLSPEGNKAVITSKNSAYDIWDFKTNSFIALDKGGKALDESWWELKQMDNSPPLFADQTPSSIFTPDGRFFISLDSGDIRFWDIELKKCLTIINDRCFGIKPGPGSTMITGSTGTGLVKIWDRKTGIEKGCFQGLASLANHALLSPDGNQLLTAGNRVAIFDVKRTKLSGTLEHANVKIMGFDPDGKLLVSVDPESAIKLWDYTNRKERMTIRLEKSLGKVATVAISPDCFLVATAHDMNKQTLKWFLEQTGNGVTDPFQEKNLPAFTNNSVNIFDMISGKKSGSIPRFGYKITSIALSPDKTLLAAGYNDNSDQAKIALFDTKTGRRLKVFENCHETDYLNLPVNILQLAFSPDNRMIASTAFSSIEIRDVGTGRILHQFKGHKRDKESEYALVKLPGGHHDTITKIAFSRKMSVLASAGADALIKIWNLDTGKEKMTLSGHAGMINSLSFTLDDRTILSGSTDGTQRLWDVSTGKEIVNLCTNQKDPPEYVFVTPEGYFTGSLSLSGFVHYVIDRRVYDFNRFYDVFFRPDLVQRKIRREDLSVYTGGVDIVTSLKCPPPLADIISPVDRAVLSDRDIEIEVQIKDTGGGIGDIRLFHNGKLVHSRGIYRVAKPRTGRDGPEPEPATLYKTATRGILIAAADRKGPGRAIRFTKALPLGKLVREKYRIRLVNGRNTISACAFNQNNTVMSALKTIQVQANVPRQEPGLFVLAVGNNQFGDSRYNLEYAAKDARDITGLLEKNAAPIFRQVLATTLIDADKRTILESISKISQKMVPEDVFVLFIASHGIAHDDLYYIIPSDFDGMAGSEDRFISSVEIMEYAKRCLPSNMSTYWTPASPVGWIP